MKSQIKQGREELVVETGTTEMILSIWIIGFGLWAVKLFKMQKLDS